ncbi:o-succinylbenzoate--CoA ligase [Cronobacter turicensis]|nr:o-succinylbenzoate--CoA ligase [Cronobacter turicensis]ELU8454382.1 o-succinylbenzoate--CoA ligase [Cronobacter turicensis]ELY4109545.1 o-succinylbenzoate--CoA ligase [Cronobacter turicensis]ELY4215965.1 o-succinylbenzoate--CoA ligase [Cronobacter turicensis]EMA1791004.1 o-succinylbenzoate--CoA ligase [Cronobacter turicensis]
MSFFDWPWRHWARLRGEAQALCLNERRLSWRELCACIDALAAGFHAQGVRDGDGVLLRAYNQPDALLAWLALLQCGARVLPLNPQLPASLLAELLPTLGLRHALVLNGGCLPVALHSLTLQPVTGERAAPWREDRIASLTLTSGSTGLPKAAVHTFRAHLASAEGVLAMIPFAPHDDWLLSLPLFHVSGQSILWRWLVAGAGLTVRDKQPLEQALRGCTHASLVATQLWRLLNSGIDVSLKAVLLGGAAIPVALTEQARKRGIRCWCGYGLTEFASTVCAKEADGLADVGQPLPGRELRIVDGEVWLRSDSMATGYWREGKIIPLTNEQGWFATRDGGRIDEGRLTLLGRMDNLFFSGGEGIQPEDVERVIGAHPWIEQIFIVPQEDAEFGQRPVAVVECSEQGDLSVLASWCADKLARFQQPVRWLRLPEALKAGGIKISRRALRDWVNQQAISDSGALDVR